MSALEDGTICVDLAVFAFHREKTAARRLAARIGVTEGDALRRVLCAVASPKLLCELISDRQQALAQQTARRDHRRQQQADTRRCKEALRWPQAAQWQGWFDGSASPNPGRIGVGAVLCGPLGIVTEISRHVGIGDSNDAEYRALLILLEEAVAKNISALSVYGDSRIVIDDVTGVHLVESLAQYRCQALALQERIGKIRFRWIPRAKNGHADRLARPER